MTDTSKLRDHASCTQLDEKCIIAHVSTDFDGFSWIFMKFRVIVNENIQKSTENRPKRGVMSCGHMQVDRNVALSVSGLSPLRRVRRASHGSLHTRSQAEFRAFHDVQSHRVAPYAPASSAKCLGLKRTALFGDPAAGSTSSNACRDSSQ